MAAGAFMNFVLGFVVLVLLISARNEPITSRVIYKINEGRSAARQVWKQGTRCWPSMDGGALWPTI